MTYLPGVVHVEGVKPLSGLEDLTGHNVNVGRHAFRAASGLRDGGREAGERG